MKIGIDKGLILELISSIFKNKPDEWKYLRKNDFI